jgi:hypothetical protein
LAVWGAREMTAALDKFVCHGLVAVCCVCKRVRDNQGTWQSLDPGVQERLGGLVTHGICPACSKRLYPWFLDENRNQVSGSEVLAED